MLPLVLIEAHLLHILSIPEAVVVPYEEIDPWSTLSVHWYVALHFIASLHGAVHDVANNSMSATKGQYHLARAAICSPIAFEGILSLGIFQLFKNLVQVLFDFCFGHGVRIM